jgi:hypothetical protein
LIFEINGCRFFTARSFELPNRLFANDPNIKAPRTGGIKTCDR